MRKMHSTKIHKLIISVVIAIMLCNFVMPNYSIAVSTQNGGSFVDIVARLLCFIPDAVNNLLQHTFVSPQDIDEYDKNDGNYTMLYSPGIIFSGTVPALDINFIEPGENKEASIIHEKTARDFYDERVKAGRDPLEPLLTIQLNDYNEYTVELKLNIHADGIIDDWNKQFILAVYKNGSYVISYEARSIPELVNNDALLTNLAKQIHVTGSHNSGVDTSIMESKLNSIIVLANENGGAGMLSTKDNPYDFFNININGLEYYLKGYNDRDLGPHIINMYSEYNNITTDIAKYDWETRHDIMSDKDLYDNDLRQLIREDILNKSIPLDQSDDEIEKIKEEIRNKISMDTSIVDTSEYKSSAAILQPIVASWYKVFRRIALIGLLSVLVYIGIRIVTSSSSAKDKAKYKKMLKNWFTAVCLLFVLHYIMSLTINVVTQINSIIGTTVIGANGEDVLLTTLRNRIALGGEWANVLSEVVIYVVITVFTVIYTIQYIRRVIYIAFLTMIAPLITLTYPLDKIKDSKAQAFDMWIKDYVFFSLLQVVHLLLYFIFVGQSLNLANKGNWLYALVAIGFLTKAEKLMKKMFGFEKSKSIGMLAAGATGALVMNAINKISHTSPQKGVNGANGGAGGTNTKNVRTVSTNPLMGLQGSVPSAPAPQGSQSAASAPSGGQMPAPGAPGGQTPAPGVPGGQTPAPGASGGQTPAQGASGGQTPALGAIGGQTPAQGATGGQTSVQGASGGQTSVQGASGGQTPAQGASGGQTPVSGVPTQQTQQQAQQNSSNNSNNKPHRWRGVKSLAGRYVRPAMGKISGIALGATGGVIGFASGVAQGDIGKALTGITAGGMAGYYGGQKIVNAGANALHTVTHLDEPVNRIKDTYNEGARGKEYVQNERFDREFRKSEEYKRLIDDNPRTPDNYIQQMLDAGITDVKKMDKILKKNAKHPRKYSIEKAIAYTTIADNCPNGVLWNDKKLIRYFQDRNISVSAEEIETLRNNIIEFK